MISVDVIDGVLNMNLYRSIYDSAFPMPNVVCFTLYHNRLGSSDMEGDKEVRLIWHIYHLDTDLFCNRRSTISLLFS